MGKSVIAAFTAVLFLSCASAYALPLEQDMDILGVELATVQSTDSGPEMHQALQKMQAAAEDAKKSAPYTLQGQAPDSAGMKDYRAGLDQLITQIVVVDKLAVLNKLPEARTEAKKLAEIRNQNHKKFR
ncbi:MULTISPECIES: cytochrome b562 [unclassified Tatumella]|uniref:cytochrome b562 n=1 Tax=unclassified Tatumella TaxID=2649542 RepID=UPI001BAF7D41|nr:MULTISPECIES: cytochrome b562 [unclassified Tatumella]MBS0855198.1 cytochrome b562 [Tatumella sp. JGM16]MBS0892903.1 cytochrome b562 [Tatumella sp. JGM130]MBS0911755.1 cytochrome b562 [Tatumella sp. JGM91]